MPWSRAAGQKARSCWRASEAGRGSAPAAGCRDRLRRRYAGAHQVTLRGCLQPSSGAAPGSPPVDRRTPRARCDALLPAGLDADRRRRPASDCRDHEGKVMALRVAGWHRQGPALPDRRLPGGPVVQLNQYGDASSGARVVCGPRSGWGMPGITGRPGLTHYQARTPASLPARRRCRQRNAAAAAGSLRHRVDRRTP